MIVDEDYLAHYGILRKSGRYPWGSGETQSERNRAFLDVVDGLKRDGLTETQISTGFGMTTTQLRAVKSIAKAEETQRQISQAQRLKDKGYSNVAIGERMGINESSVRALLAPGKKDKADVLEATTSMLRDQVNAKGYIDIGVGVERHVGVSKEKLSTAVARLKEDGYTVHYLQVDQLGTGLKTTVKVLAKPDVTYGEVYRNRGEIKQVTNFSEDGGRSFGGALPPLSVHPKRISVRYAEQGGADADGVIYVRPGVKDLSLGRSRYAQVRIAVNGTHFLKGMAMYKDDLPPGVDLVFNTNKKDTGNKLDAMKPMKDDPDLPFGAIVRQITSTEGGKRTVKSALNVVNEEGDWGNWSKSLSSQMLSKQSPTLAKAQLAMTYERRRDELDRINALTNPAVKKKLLEEFSDGADSAAVHLKAAALPRQGSHVILPINSMKPTEIYAPNYRNGESVVLVRFPHGGIFEIPELTVNNRHPQARKLLGNARDAVGINSKVAERLSGADFDGDTVLVIPNNKGKVKTAPPLDGLKNFDPKASYPAYPGMPRMSARTKGIQMGVVSNLISDMHVHGASSVELARAVRHSMVVIDAEKHHLNYKQSAVDNGIAQLKAKYQGGATAGASTLISRASAQIRVAERTPRSAAKGGAVDKVTGKRVYEETGSSYTVGGKTVVRKVVSKRLAETDDANTLSSGTLIEKIYADHSNRLKALANEARLSSVHTNSAKYSPSAKAAYAAQVDTLNAKLNVALKNAPLERQAQVLANAVVSQKRQANPGMEASELKKVRSQALTEARIRTGAQKQRIEITPTEWEAIQAGAISNNKLTQILNNADMDQVRSYATPRESTLMTSTKTQRAQSMVASGYTQAEIADALGVSLSTLKTSIE